MYDALSVILPWGVIDWSCIVIYTGLVYVCFCICKHVLGCFDLDGLVTHENQRYTYMSTLYVHTHMHARTSSMPHSFIWITRLTTNNNTSFLLWVLTSYILRAVSMRGDCVSKPRIDLERLVANERHAGTFDDEADQDFYGLSVHAFCALACFCVYEYMANWGGVYMLARLCACTGANLRMLHKYTCIQREVVSLKCISNSHTRILWLYSLPKDRC